MATGFVPRPRRTVIYSGCGWEIRPDWETSPRELLPVKSAAEEVVLKLPGPLFQDSGMPDYESQKEARLRWLNFVEMSAASQGAKEERQRQRAKHPLRWLYWLQTRREHRQHRRQARLQDTMREVMRQVSSTNHNRTKVAMDLFQKRLLQSTFPSETFVVDLQQLKQSSSGVREDESQGQGTCSGEQHQHQQELHEPEMLCDAARMRQHKMMCQQLAYGPQRQLHMARDREARHKTQHRQKQRQHQLVQRLWTFVGSSRRRQSAAALQQQVPHEPEELGMNICPPPLQEEVSISMPSINNALATQNQHEHQQQQQEEGGEATEALRPPEGEPSEEVKALTRVHGQQQLPPHQAQLAALPVSNKLRALVSRSSRRLLQLMSFDNTGDENER